jgi:hypothetical protein
MNRKQKITFKITCQEKFSFISFHSKNINKYRYKRTSFGHGLQKTAVKGYLNYKKEEEY